MSASTILILLKIFFMALFFLIVMYVGTIPFRSKRFKTNPVLRMIGTTFAGSLFVNVALIHLLPESADTLENAIRTSEGEEVFPLANFLMMIGFLITVFFTRVLSSHSHDDDHHHGGDDQTQKLIASISEEKAP